MAILTLLTILETVSARRAWREERNAQDFEASVTNSCATFKRWRRQALAIQPFVCIQTGGGCLGRSQSFDRLPHYGWRQFPNPYAFRLLVRAPLRGHPVDITTMES
jgi:hypothetical protein